MSKRLLEVIIFTFFCLGEVGSTLYTKANLILCKRDYLRQVTIIIYSYYLFLFSNGFFMRRIGVFILFVALFFTMLIANFYFFRLFGTTGYCAACNKVIPAFEMVMRARSNVYHLECFACQQCNNR